MSEDTAERAFADVLRTIDDLTARVATMRRRVRNDRAMECLDEVSVRIKWTRDWLEFAREAEGVQL